MTFVYVVAAGVLIVLVVHFAVGWHVSSNLHRGLLRVGPKTEEPAEVRVRAVTRTEIELESPTPRQDIGHPGTLALVWEEGNAVVGDVISAGEGTITRRLETFGDGKPPVCSGPIETCPPVVLDPWMYATDPGDAGLDFVETSYQSPLGAVGAWVIPSGDGGRWAILVHGWTAQRREMIRMARTFHAAGITSLVIDYRNDPGAPTDPTGRYRFGLSEWEDLDAAVSHALDSGADDVVLAGASTGAAIAMAFLERSTLASRVSGVVLDSPNLILADTVRWSTADRRLPHLMFEFGLWITDLRWKVDWGATNYLQRADRTLAVPTWVAHGTADRRVPIAESRQLEARAPEHVRLIEFPAAGHVMSWNADPQRFDTELGSFLETI